MTSIGVSVTDNESYDETRIYKPGAPGSTADTATPEPAAEAPAHPSRIGRYSIVRVLGQGGFGLVYLAHDSQLDRPVALKVPHRWLLSTPDATEACLAEARTAARLDHPNIVPVHDFGRTDEFPCFVVSKYVSGRNLAVRIAQAFVVPPGIARALLSDADVSRSWLAASFERHVPIPEVLFEWTARRKIDVWYANPSLAQHIGNASTIWMDAGIAGGRRAPWFSGGVETEFVEEESFDGFPEAALPCDDDVRDEYVAAVERGRRRMRKLSVVLCGLCRDVRVHLPRTAARVERLGAMFDRYRAVLFENDSIDATREFLFDWQSQNPLVDVISESAGAAKYPRSRSLQRAGWLARCRNRCRERIVEQYPDYEYVIVFDSDLPGGWSYDGIAHSFGGDDWDFVGSYGIQRRLDRGANMPPYLHFDLWAFHPARGTAARKLIDHSKLSLRRGGPFLPVESCFGGLGLYRAACMKAAEYGGSDCEHVVFHDRLRRAGLDRLYMNPSQIGVDPVLSPPVFGYVSRSNGVYFVQGTQASDELRWLIEQVGGPDLVFIDGDHSHEAVRADWEFARPRGRCVAFHDIVAENLPGVRSLWEEIRSTHPQTWEFVDSGWRPTLWAGIGAVDLHHRGSR